MCHGIESSSIGLSICAECGEPIYENEADCIYDGERCHLSCAAEAEDNADFDNWFINK